MRKKATLTFLFFLLFNIPLYYVNHFFFTIFNPFQLAIVSFIGLLIAPLLIRVLNSWLKKEPAIKPSLLFLLAAGLFFLMAGFFGVSTLTVSVHDTYYVLAHANPVILNAVLFCLFSAIYAFYPKITRRPLNLTLSYWHFWLCFIPIDLFLQPSEAPLRYFDYTTPYSEYAFTDLNIIVILLAQIPLVINLISSLFKSRQQKPE